MTKTTLDLHANDSHARVLNSWKEIAVYVGRSVRTVQRWERDLGLPVHRPRGRERTATMAFTAELDAWLRRTPVRSDENKDQHSTEQLLIPDAQRIGSSD